jgi:hypothetical protein
MFSQVLYETQCIIIMMLRMNFTRDILTTTICDVHVLSFRYVRNHILSDEICWKALHKEQISTPSVPLSKKWCRGFGFKEIRDVHFWMEGVLMFVTCSKIVCADMVGLQTYLPSFCCGLWSYPQCIHINVFFLSISYIRFKFFILNLVMSTSLPKL